MLKTVVVDDEPYSRETLRGLLSRYCAKVEIVGEAGGVPEAKELILVEEPDLVFLDISMPGGSGFDLLKQFNRIEFEIIFVTAYNEYALQAIKSCALGYLLKPIQIDELKTAVEKAGEITHLKDTKSRLDQLLRNLDPVNANQHKIAIPSQRGLDFIFPSEIIRLEADGSYTRIYMNDGRKLTSTWHLKAYEGLLSSSQFFRAHHSHLIHLVHIVEYHKGNGGYVVMSDASVIDISKRRKKEFLQLFELPE